MKTIKNYKPTTPSLRFTSLENKSNIWSGNPVKHLLSHTNTKSGRNNSGKITVRHKSGGHKKMYRIVDFKRRKFDIAGAVERIEYDPFRSCNIALIKYLDGQYSYIIAPNEIQVGSEILSSKLQVDIKPGNSTILSKMPLGSLIHNIEIRPGSGGSLIKSAGTSAQLIGKNLGQCSVRLQSGEIRNFNSECMATYGTVGNADQKNKTIGKAGRSRWLGIRPTVRGVAMNPVDHPHGGGEGKTSGGRHPVSPTGRVVKGKKTRKRKKYFFFGGHM